MAGIRKKRRAFVERKDFPGTRFHPGVAQFAFGFYSVMLTSTALGLITMVLFKPRGWCVYCPMGIMTQLICKVKNTK